MSNLQSSQWTTWVVTKEVNEYGQDGHYFVCAYEKKPDVAEIRRLVNCSLQYAEHIHNGGGRSEGREEVWYFLTEMQSGCRYDSNP